MKEWGGGGGGGRGDFTPLDKNRWSYPRSVTMEV